MVEIISLFLINPRAVRVINSHVKQVKNGGASVPLFLQEEDYQARMPVSNRTFGGEWLLTVLARNNQHREFI
jgi:hypothetical protein